MPINKPTLLAGLGVLLVLGGGGGLLVWPAYAEAHGNWRRIDELERKAKDLDNATRQVEQLTTQVSALQQVIARDLKSVPESPDIAGLIRKLSLPVDGRTVTDQQFLAGQPTAAVAGETDGMQAMPVLVDMTATFDAVVAMLKSVESMDRLVRVVSVRIGCKRASDSLEDINQLTAALGLEAVYKGPVTQASAPQEAR